MKLRTSLLTLITLRLTLTLLLVLASACGKNVNLNQASDLPSPTQIKVDSSQITLQGTFLDRVKKIQLLGEQVEMTLDIQTQKFEQIEATPPNPLVIALGKTYSLFISSAEADTTSNITFVINPGEITPTLLDRPYLETLNGGTIQNALNVSGLLTTNTGLTVQGTATIIPKNTVGTALTVGSSTVPANLTVNGTGGVCTIGSTSGALSCTSDIRLKKNINQIPHALEKLQSLRGVYYQWKSSFKKDTAQHLGLIAQEVEKKFPELVSEIKTDEGTYRSVDYAGLVAPLVEAVKELNTQVKDLKTQIHEQEKTSHALRQELEQLKRTKKLSPR
jgi:hypothetical protein